MAIKTPEIDLREIGLKRNMVINGAFDYWQRFANTALTSSAIDNIKVADRFASYSLTGGTANISISRNTDVPTVAELALEGDVSVLPSYSLRYLVNTPKPVLAASNELVEILQAIEGNIGFAATKGKITVSFWFKTNKTGKYGVSIRNFPITHSKVKSFTVTSANIWKKYSTVFDLSDCPGAFGQGSAGCFYVTLSFANSANRTVGTEDVWTVGNFAGAPSQVNFVDTANNEFKLTMVQVTAGNKVQPFERAAHDAIQELILCQRYYEKSYDIDTAVTTNTQVGINRMGVASAGTTGLRNISFKVKKRTIPTIATYTDTGTVGLYTDEGGGTTRAPAFGEIGETGYTFIPNAAQGGGLVQKFHWIADAEL